MLPLIKRTLRINHFVSNTCKQNYKKNMAFNKNPITINPIIQRKFATHNNSRYPGPDPEGDIVLLGALWVVYYIFIRNR